MNAELMRSRCEEVSQVMKVIAHPQRLMILCHLSEGEKNVGELTHLCQISQSQVSQFLTRMQREKLLEARKEGSFSYYRIGDKNLLKLLQSMHKIFCS